MLKRAIIAFFVGGACLAALSGQGFSLPSAYDNLISLFPIDPNKGLTVFLSTRIPMGGTAESMGMAYTAVCEDASFLELNPAGSAVLSNTELALYHNNWIADTRIEGLVYTTRLGHLGFALGGKWLYLPFTEYDDYGARVTTGYYSEMLAIGNAALHLFPGYYFYGLSVGANLKLGYRSMPDYGDENGLLIPGSGASQSAVAIMTDLGLLTRFNLLKFYAAREKNFSLGLAIKNLGPPVLEEPLPTTITAGLAYRPLRPFLFSFDFSQPINLVDPSQSERFYFGIGYAMDIASFWDLHAGLLIKGGPRLSLGTSISVNPLILVINYTLDLTTQTTPLNRLSIEARFDMGDRGRQERANMVDNLYILGLEAYAQDRIDEAIAYWQEALNLDPYFDPAREGLRLAAGYLDLRQRVLDTQRLE